MILTNLCNISMCMEIIGFCATYIPPLNVCIAQSTILWSLPIEGWPQILSINSKEFYIYKATYIILMQMFYNNQMPHREASSWLHMPLTLLSIFPSLNPIKMSQWCVSICTLAFATLWWPPFQRAFTYDFVHILILFHLVSLKK
jgi:hypothetical protein